MNASDVIRRLQPKLRDRCRASQFYMQPVQDITVDDRVSRTQYQYTLEDPDVNELNQWTDIPVEVERCRNWKTWPPTSRPAALLSR